MADNKQHGTTRGQNTRGLRATRGPHVHGKNTPGNKKPGAHKKRKKISLRRKLLAYRRVFKLAVVVATWGGMALLVILAYYAHDLPSIKKLTQQTESHTVTVVATDGSLLAKRGSTYGDELSFEEFPPHLIQAVMAIEDRRFFYHWGLDPIGLMRAMAVNISTGKVVQGGSTVTQQLAKVVFLSPERTLKRKVQELLLSFWLELRYSKHEIMSMYLNRVYLGGGYYGVDAASRGYFGKSARWVNLGESALLAGLLKAPSRYSPFSNPELSLKRADQVIASMVDADYITEAEAKTAAVLPNTAPTNKGGALYFVDWVLSRIPDYIGIVDDDLTVITTLNPQLQKLAEDAMANVMTTEGPRLKASQAALLSMAPSGDILAMLGGIDYRASQYNRVVQSQRQPGSAFKFFVYLAAMENGFEPEDEFEDKPLSYIDGTGKQWSPQNYHEDYKGWMTLREAFALSINTIAIQLLDAVGLPSTLSAAYRLGVQSELGENLSLALGTSEMNMMEMVQSYAHVANAGYATFPFGIREIRNSKGEVLYKRSNTYQYRVLSPQVVIKMNRLMTGTLEMGTGEHLAIGRPSGGKSGTSQGFRDAWFIGYTPQIVTGVWTGNDDNTPMIKVTGSVLPGRIWQDYMKAAHESIPVEGLQTHTSIFRNIFGRRQPDPEPLIPMEAPEVMPNTEAVPQEGTKSTDGTAEDKKREFWDRIVDDAGTAEEAEKYEEKQGDVEYKYPSSRR
jgi:penicillin-binding protein 1A